VRFFPYAAGVTRDRKSPCSQIPLRNSVLAAGVQSGDPRTMKYA
jgi:hypothetical protein